MRGILYQFQKVEDLLTLVEAGAENLELEVPAAAGGANGPGATGALREGEWVLASFCLARAMPIPEWRSECSTALAARVVDRGEGPRVAFDARDWAHLLTFVARVGGWARDPEVLRGSLPPQRRVAFAEAHDEDTGVRPVAGAPAGTGLAHVLVVDDEPDVRKVISCMLRSGGFTVVEAASEEEAFEQLASGPVDLIVLDGTVDGTHPIDFCKRLRRAEATCDIPALVLTSYASSLDPVRALRAGVSDFLGKPFRAPELRARVLSLLKRSSQPPLMDFSTS